MLSFHIPYFPPSTNKAYFVRHGRLHLSDAGRAFKTNVISHIVTTTPNLKFFKPNVPYGLLLKVHSDMMNAGWPDKCKTRYKKWDATNRVKLVEDALKEAFGIDDSQFLMVSVVKYGPVIVEGNATECLDAFVWNMEEETCELIVTDKEGGQRGTHHLLR